MNFIANGFQSQGQKLFTLSSCFSSTLESVNVDTFIEDEAAWCYIWSIHFFSILDLFYTHIYIWSFYIDKLI